MHLQFHLTPEDIFKVVNLLLKEGSLTPHTLFLLFLSLNRPAFTLQVNLSSVQINRTEICSCNRVRVWFQALFQGPRLSSNRHDLFQESHSTFKKVPKIQSESSPIKLALCSLPLNQFRIQTYKYYFSILIMVMIKTI